MRNTHWVCFNCRISVKDGTRHCPPAGYTGLSLHQPVKACTRCQSPMVDLGIDFKAPRRLDRRQWRKVALLHQKGYRFGRARRGSRSPKTLQGAKALRPLIPERHLVGGRDA